jgi:peptide deformylase
MAAKSVTDSILKIINYPHPTLRRASKPIRRVDARLRQMIDDMFRLMYAAEGIGLAANQVGLPLRLFICNLSGKPDEGEPRVFINPVLSRAKGQSEKEEGCLSLPGLYAQVRRPESVHVEAYALDGSPIQEDVGGMMARVVQHEVDHLNGILFIDRLSPTEELQVQPSLEEFELEFRSRQDSGATPSNEQLAQHWAIIEQQYGMTDSE